VSETGQVEEELLDYEEEAPAQDPATEGGNRTEVPAKRPKNCKQCSGHRAEVRHLKKEVEDLRAHLAVKQKKSKALKTELRKALLNAAFADGQLAGAELTNARLASIPFPGDLPLALPDPNLLNRARRGRNKDP